MPTVICEPSIGETEAVARELFTQFAREQYTVEGINTTEEQLIEEQLQEFHCSNGFNPSNPLLASVGSDLRRISEEFARSPARQEVRERAFRININDLTHEEFNLLLNELFLDGNITRERIVILFFFCSDVAFSAFRTAPIRYFKRLIQWSISYIIDRICRWVQSQGGWEVVLGSYVPKLAVTVFACVGSVALLLFIYRSLR